MTRSAPIPTILLPLALALASCAGEERSAAEAERLAGTDPAVTSALADPILTDPALSQQANATAVRPPGGPLQAHYPPGQDPGEAAAAEECGASLASGPEWARRLPRGFAPYPGARIAEAAGADSEACWLRMVVLLSDDPPGKVVDWYRKRARAARFSAETQPRGDLLALSGTEAGSGTGYFLVAAPAGEGSEIHLLVREEG